MKSKVTKKSVFTKRTSLGSLYAAFPLWPWCSSWFYLSSLGRCFGWARGSVVFTENSPKSAGFQTRPMADVPRSETGILMSGTGAIGENATNEANRDEIMSIAEIQGPIQVTANSGALSGLDKGVPTVCPLSLVLCPSQKPVTLG
jgi:hypothetical protein